MLLVAGVASSACSGERKGSFEQLPQTAQSVIVQHFDKAAIASVIIDNDDKTTEYEVRFTDGTELDFDKNGGLKKAETKRGELPNALIPIDIVTYVKNNYPSALIVEWETGKKGSTVELNTGIDLKFNNLNQFVGLGN